MPLKFRKKPIVIEAKQWTGNNLDELLAWGCPGTLLPASENGLIIGTLEDGPNCEAVHVADRWDWIICGVKGEFYPCKPDIFAATYDPATAPDPEAEIVRLRAERDNAERRYKDEYAIVDHIWEALGVTEFDNGPEISERVATLVTDLAAVRAELAQVTQERGIRLK